MRLRSVYEYWDAAMRSPMRSAATDVRTGRAYPVACLAAGHYLPLADGPRIARGPGPSGLLQSGSEDTDKGTRRNRLIGAFLSKAPKAGGPCRSLQPRDRTELLEFGLGAGFHQLLDGSFGVGLGNAFLDVLGCAVDQVLGFLQTQAGDFAHGLDDGHLVRAGFGQHDVELGLLFGGGSATGGGTTSGRSGHGGGGHAELLFNG